MRLILALSLALWPSTAIPQNIYFGNLHSHTSYSDGRGTPAEAFAAARVAGLDFFAITEHNHLAGDGKGDARDGLIIAAQPELYSGQQRSLRETALYRTEDGQFVALFGQEFSTISRGNHVNVFEISPVVPVPNGEFGQLRDWVAGQTDSTGATPLLQFNHPRNESRFLADYGRDDFPDERAWVAALDPFVELIEVLNAPALRDGEGLRAEDSQSDYFRYLNLGFHVGPSVGHDNHYKNWGRSTEARIAVSAPALTREAILSALKQRRTYATEDRNLRIDFRANDGLAGDILPVPPIGSELRLTITLVDDDEPDAAYRVDVFKDAPGDKPATAPVDSFEFRGDVRTPARLEGIRLSSPGEFVIVKVTQFNSDEHGEDDRAWTAPVWFEAEAPLPAAPPLRIVSLLPNPAGEDETDEEVTIRNIGTIAVSLSGWRLRDLADNLWPLDGVTLQPGEELRLRRNREALSLNNGGDRIRLLDPNGAIVHSIEYGPVREGEFVLPR